MLATAYLALVTPDARPSLPADTAWHLVDALPPTAFDHGSIVGSARNRLRAKLSYTNIGFALAPETFTISQLRDTYAAALGHPVSATNLQRILTRRGVIEPTTRRLPPHLNRRPPGDPLPLRRPRTGGNQPLRRLPPPPHRLAPPASPAGRRPANSNEVHESRSRTPSPG